MNREKLDQIAKLLNNLLYTEDLENLNKLYQEIGIEPISEENLKKFENGEVENDKIDEIFKNIISKVEEQLKVEDEEYFYYKLEVDYIPYIENKRIKEEYLEQYLKQEDIDEVIKVEIIEKLNEDERIKLLDGIKKEFYKAEIIAGIKDDKKKIDLLEKLQEDYNKKEVIQTIKDDEMKIQALDKVTDEIHKAEIISSIQDDKKKIDLLYKLKEKNLKKDLIYKISKENITEFVKENRERTDDTIKFLLKYCIIDDDILYILSEKLQLNDQQKEIIKKLYTKNDELLETINYKILDEKYNELYDKLSTLTSYTDIQEKILNLDEKKYEIFIKALKVHEEKNGEWINFTGKILTNLQGKDYKKLIDNLKGIELTEEEIENIGNIIAKENILNITTIEEAKSYENIKQKVCNSIIQEDNSINLEDYPKISELSNIDRMKLAVLMKVYGQTLNETDKLLNLYGRDIENIEKTDKNTDIIIYIQSLKTIKETQDENLLKNIYEKSETISLDNVYDIEYIENQLKDIYMETFNSKLYEPREEDIIGTEEVRGKEINIYDAGTEFGISLHSVEAFCNSNDMENNYVKKWNRPKTISQGYSTSYIRNDMLATTQISNVVYGFNKYDKGSLRLSGKNDIYSISTEFIPTAERKIEFLSENTQINESENYNEMVFSRYNQDGTRKQPDYVVFIKNTKAIGLEANIQKEIWENSKKAASEFGIPIVIVDREKCIESEKSKISEMIGEYAKNPNEDLMQSIMQKFSNNRNGMHEDFSDSTWEKLWRDKGFEEIPELLSREQIIKNNIQKQKNNSRKTITMQEIEENYEEISQEEKEQGMTELRKRAKMIMQEKQKNEEVEKDNEER